MDSVVEKDRKKVKIKEKFSLENYICVGACNIESNQISGKLHKLLKSISSDIDVESLSLD